MSYYIRFFMSGSGVPTDAQLGEALTQAGLSFVDDVVMRNKEPLGQISRCNQGEDLFEEEMAEIKEGVDQSPWSFGKLMVKRELSKTRTILAVQVLSGGRTADQTLDSLEPLFEYLRKFSPISQGDAEGFYRNGKLICAEPEN